MPFQHYQDLIVEVTKTLRMECSRHPRWLAYELGVPTTMLMWSSHIPATPRIWSTKSKHALTIPVYSPLQELCFVELQSHHHHAWSGPCVAVSAGEDFRLHTDCKHHDQTVLTISSHKPFSMLFGRIERHWEGFEKKPRKIESDHLAASPRKFFIPQHSLHTQTCKNLHTGMIRECFNFQGMLTTCQSLASLI